MKINREYRRSIEASRAVMNRADDVRIARAFMFTAWVVLMLALVAIGAHWE